MTTHTPVLKNQVLRFLEPKPGRVVIDCTLGLGGHAEAILELLHGKGMLYAIEVDERNLETAKNRLTSYDNVHYTHDTFENLEELGRRVLQKETHIDGILFDLGLSSPHVDEPQRGFSFQKEGPLDMRFDPRQRITAADIVNSYSLKDLISIFQTYGEEKFSHLIARKIVEHRRNESFKTTTQLADFIANIFSKGRPNFFFKRHPSTRIFQAIRIATNREIEALQAGLQAAISLISKNGRIVVISYHSLEDRIVKNLFRDAKREKILTVLTKKPIEAEEDEIRENPRSRSAKLRAAERL